MKILLVDEDRIVAELLTEYFQRLDHEVHICGTRQEAARVMDDESFDCAFADIEMPEGGGVEFLNDVKQQAPGMPVIMMCGHTRMENAIDVMRKGAFCILTKPFTLQDLAIAIFQVETVKMLLVQNQETGPSTIVRSIEFPPEYHQAGISILSYFGTILRRKYPDTKAKIRIVQDGLRITMIIDPIHGDREIFEHALSEYGMVIKGAKPLNEFTDDPLLLMELKNELRYAKARIESQKDLLEYQHNQIRSRDDQIDKFMSLMEKLIGTAEQPAITVTVSPCISANISPSIDFAPDISAIQSDFRELIDKLELKSEESMGIQNIINDLEKAKTEKIPERLKLSPAMEKIGKFFDNVERAENSIGKIIKGVQGCIQLVQRIAERYNSIAGWCGLPKVPKPFLKD